MKRRVPNVQINAFAKDWLKRHRPAIYRKIAKGATLYVASPTNLKKKVDGKLYDAVRWHWNLYPNGHPPADDAPPYILVQLRWTPRNPSDIEVEAIYLVPKADVQGKKVITRYRSARDSRRGAFLDRYQLPAPRQ